MTLEQLSERAGNTPNYLGRIENEKVDPSLSIVRATARALRVRVGDLVDESPAPIDKRHQRPTRTYAEAMEIANVVESLPLDVRETLLPSSVLRRESTRAETPVGRNAPPQAVRIAVQSGATSAQSTIVCIMTTPIELNDPSP